MQYEDTEPTNSTRDAFKFAEENGLEVVIPDADQLFVDLDSKESEKIFFARINDISKIVKDYDVLPSKSGKRKHGYVQLNRNISCENERILLQLLLGSDSMRELLSWRRVVLKDQNPTIFFEKKKPEIKVQGNGTREIRFED